MTDWAQYSREVQAASDAGWKQQKAEIDTLKQQLRDAQSALRAEREKALREVVPNFLGIDHGSGDETCVVVIKTHSDGAMEVIDAKHGDEARAILRALEGGE